MLITGGYFAVQYSGRNRERAQSPRAPLPYSTSDVLVPLDDGCRLAGTLVLPAGSGPFPAAVLLGVAGPNDRDLHYRGHRGFAVMARLLVISGERDQVLPPRAHLPPLRRGLVGKPAAFITVPAANHLLMPRWTGLPFEYAHLETTIDPTALFELCSWINVQ